MPLLALPVELLDKIFIESIRVRSFQRAMRLRLVSRGFMYYTNRAIFYSRILDTEYNKWLHPLNCFCNTAEVSFMQKYLAYRIPLEDDPRLLGVRVRRVAERICELTGNTGDGGLNSCIQSLCGLYFWGDTYKTGDLIESKLGSEPTEEHLKLDLVTAAVYLNLPTLASQLHSEKEDDYSISLIELDNMRWARYGIASFYGNLDMIKILLATDPTKEAKVGRLVPMDYVVEMIKWSALGGHSEIFNFALDNSEEFKLSHRRDVDYRDLRDAMNWTAFPKDYQRVAAIFGSESEVFSAKQDGDLDSRLCESADNGRVEMVRYFLDQGACLNNPLAKRGCIHESESGITRRTTTPLLSALRRCPLGSEAVVKLMLERGADPNWYPPEKTPLMAAVHNNRFEITRMLVDYGADVNDGSPAPIVLAARNENTEIFQYLRERGATIDTPETGSWAMAYAKFYGLDSMVALLVHEGVDETAALQRASSRKETWTDWTCVYKHQPELHLKYSF
ncbi:uncharacterized protein BP5553_02682 [Venustampulla echinocandica]|uniref:Uncharacterized protein n=1 Tax=Venustampulla echinocandica TaxID=2656787 RepID=A0A370TS28_9HELO|nr:uncharacterized protein BP5553_02682 [Venustampulla echinocandica]RDL38342.1 hypothetical protein BP5553_02682 [Venustampulla echinocandica]